MDSASQARQWIEDEFNRLATNSVIGDPNGKTAMAYLRVSSTEQAEDGRTGLPRQLLHIHQKASTLGLAIPWHLVFFDDATGFEFRNRPELTRLRELVKQSPRPSNDLVIENLDRLSREASWHQGFLLEEFEKTVGIRVHFWKELGSKLERAVYGTVAEDRIRTDLERMATGNLIKARSGRVTARTPAYGYRFVNSHGEETGTRRDTHYAPLDEEARVIRSIYTALVKERQTLSVIARTLAEAQIAPPKTSRSWDASLVRTLIKNPVYKGDYYAHRYTYEKRFSKRLGKDVMRKVERPRDEWIKVSVPALVSHDVWDAAQKILSDNKLKSPRNARRDYLLLGLTVCADCDPLKMSTGKRKHRKTTHAGPKEYETSCYRCQTRASMRFKREAFGRHCTMPQIATHRLDAMVWNAVIGVLFDRERLEEGMERYFSRQKLETTAEELEFLQTQLTTMELEDERLYQAYMAQAFDADEYARRRRDLKERKGTLESKKDDLVRRLQHQSSAATRKQQILKSVADLKRQAGEATPFDLRRRIIVKVVDRIVVNTREEWFELEGAIAGRFEFGPFDVNSVYRGFAPPPA